MEILAKVSEAFNHGGFWMWPILAFQLISFAIIVDRSLALFKKRKPNQSDFVNQFEDDIKRGEIEKVVTKAQASSQQNALAPVIVAGAQAALNFGGKEEIQGKMDEVLLHENSKLDLRVGYLAMLGNVATLTGLLGTISGMIKSFAAVAIATSGEKATILSAGISEAMNCTAFGLIVAIPALIAYAVLQNRANAISEDLNQSALKVFNWLSYSFDPVSAKAFPKMSHGSSNRDAQREMNA